MPAFVTREACSLTLFHPCPAILVAPHLCLRWQSVGHNAGLRIIDHSAFGSRSQPRSSQVGQSWERHIGVSMTLV